MTRINIIKGSNLEPEFLHLNPSGTVPVLIDGSNQLRDSKSIMEYLDKIDEPLGIGGVDARRVSEWLQKIDAWDDELYSLSCIAHDRAIMMTTFKRKVCIARMARNPDLAIQYTSRLSHYQTLEQRLQDSQEVETVHAQLEDLLNAAEAQLSHTKFLAGQQFSLADVSFLPVLTIAALSAKQKHLVKPQLFDYLARMKRRASYKKVISKRSDVLVQMGILFPTLMSMKFRTATGQF